MAKEISLVLGSGGARGYTHIGVIESLLERGYEIKSISGCSMGALIGGLYAAGKLDEYKNWVLSLDGFELLKLVDFSFSGNGMIKGDKVFEKIKSLVGETKIETLPIPFTAVATDITDQKEVWFQRGNLTDAIRASIAIPTIFTPVQIGKKVLVDGGILNPLPTVPVLADRTDLTIAVNLNADRVPNDETINGRNKSEFEKKIANFLEKNGILKKERGLNYFTIISETIETAQNLIARYEIAAHEPDLIINIPKNLCGFYEFDKAKALIDYGRQIAMSHLDTFEKSQKEHP